MFLVAPLLTEAAASAAAIAAVGRGEPAALLVGGEDDAVGYLVAAAAEIEPETVARMSAAGNGRLCAAMSAERIEKLQIPTLPSARGDERGLGMHVAVDAGSGGGSNSGRTETLRALADPGTDAAELSFPGHIHPVSEPYATAGVVEAAIDLMILARRPPVVALTELARMHDEARPASEILAQAVALGVPVAHVSEVAALRAPLPTHVAQSMLPTTSGRWRAIGFSGVDGNEHLALVLGEVDRCWTTPVYVHRACLLGDALGSLVCDCGERLHMSIGRLVEHGGGVIIYLTRGAPFDALLSGDHAHPPGAVDTATELLTFLGLRQLELVARSAVTAEDLRAQGFEVSD
jgi:3,4-dihydroxy 2-butanone 4-phosphate synthase/GTP cyclohydrolase II